MGWICIFQIVHMSSATLIWSCVARNNRSSYLSSSSWATLSLVSPHISYFVQLFITLSNMAFAFLVHTASCDNTNRGINHASSGHRWSEASHLVPKVHSCFRSSKEELKKERSQDRTKEVMESALSSQLYWKGFLRHQQCITLYNKDVTENIARIANAVQVTICLLVSTSVY